MNITIEPKFPKLERGMSCGGRVITNDKGKRVGFITREIEWIDTGFATVSYGRYKITGYKLEIWVGGDLSETNEQEFNTLGEATAAARKFFRSYTPAPETTTHAV